MMIAILYNLIQMNSSLQSKGGAASSRVSVSEGISGRDDLKHLQNNVEVMRNRVQLLKQQLQKEKSVISKHRSLTQEVVKQKVEYNKMSTYKKRDHGAISSEISSLRARNHSYREMHKNEMNNILKALYLVKLDDARQIKNTSLENRKSLEKINESYHIQQKQKKKQIIEQSEMAKQRYLEYWKNKLNSVFAQDQLRQQELQNVAQQRKKQLSVLQLQQMNLLEEINQVRMKEMEAKKQYVAALSLSTKEVAEASREKEKEERELGRSKISQKQLLPSPSEPLRSYKPADFFTKNPNVSLMSSNDIRIPRPKVDKEKFQIILQELKRLQKKAPSE